MRGRLGHSNTAVIPGFYGSMPNGEIKTFSRGGSDITGAIVARAARAGRLRKLDGCFWLYDGRPAYS